MDRMWVWVVLMEGFPGLLDVSVVRRWGKGTDGLVLMVIGSKEVVKVVDIERS